MWASLYIFDAYKRTKKCSRLVADVTRPKLLTAVEWRLQLQKAWHQHQVRGHQSSSVQFK